MADRRLAVPSPVLTLRGESGQLITPDEFAERIENMFPTEEGTLRAVWGPLPYTPARPGGGGAPPSFPPYGHLHGIFHANLQNGSREVLLLHSDDEIWVFEGWDPLSPWRVLLGPAGSGAQRVAVIPNSQRPEFPTQFVSTTAGILIIPQGGRAFFYDGIEVLPFGYDRVPGPPSGLGPTGTDNAKGYSFDGDDLGPTHGKGRLGTVETTAGAVKDGKLLPGEYRAAYRWIDRWGNISPLSHTSGPITFHVELGADGEMLKKVVAWSGIEPGPEGTIGRILYRTKDTLHAGTLDMFEVPSDAMGTSGAFATLPDNISTFFPDNIPDTWLLVAAEETLPVPQFKLACLAFGRLWIANTGDEPGLLLPSLPGRWGTFAKDTEIYPDPNGAEITGLLATEEGLLVFTASSTFIIKEAPDSKVFFASSTLHPTIGCVAPNSLAVLSSGVTIWLGREGFYGLEAGKIGFIGLPVKKLLRRLNQVRARGVVSATSVRSNEYRCWLPIDGDIRYNSLCLIYDGLTWTRRTDVAVGDVTVTRDHRHYTLVAGQSTDTTPTTREGVWLLDHEVETYRPQARAAVVETCWIKNARSTDRTTPIKLYVWLREFRDSTTAITVDIYRDWRPNTIVETTTLTGYPTDDEPNFWNEAILDGAGVEWLQRRPYWTKAAIYVPSCETFKLVISSTENWEFIGLSYDDLGDGSGRMKIPR